MSALIAASQGEERWQPQAQRDILPLWWNGIAFSLMPGLGWGRPMAAAVAPSAVGTFADTRFGQAYKSGASATKSWNTACGSLGTEYTLLVLATYVASQPLIADDSPTLNLNLQCGGAAGKFVLTAYNTSGTAYAATSAAVSSAEQLTGTAIGARVSGSQSKVALTIDGVTVTTATTGTLRAPSNPRIGGLKAGTAPNAVIALAAAWTYYMPDSELLDLLANPFQIFRSARRFYFGAAGGNVWNLSLVEAGAASDAPGASAAYVAALSEAGLAQDVPGATASYVAALVEVGSAQDWPGATAVYTVALAEAGSASDLENFGAAATSVSIAEAGAAVDMVAATVIFSAALSESGSASDAVSAQASFVASLAEAGNASDAPSATASYVVSIVEAGSAADSENFGGAATSAALTEAGFATDTISALVTFSAAMVEAGNATDQAAATAALSAMIAEQGTALDAPNAIASMSVSIVESGAALDVTSWSLPYTLATDPYFAVPTLTRSFTVRALGRTFIVTTLNRKFDA